MSDGWRQTDHYYNHFAESEAQLITILAYFACQNMFEIVLYLDNCE